jgi:hypothetical protein
MGQQTSPWLGHYCYCCYTTTSTKMYGNKLRLLNAQTLPEIITLTSSFASSLSLSQSLSSPKKKDMPHLMKKKPRRTVLDTSTLKTKVDNNGNNNSRGLFTYQCTIHC